MNENTKMEVSREIMNTMIAKACENGFDANDPVIITLLKEEDEMNKFNWEVIDKIINEYGPLIKNEGGNK